MVGAESRWCPDGWVFPRNGKLIPPFPAPSKGKGRHDTIAIRSLRTRADFEAAVVIQDQIWGAALGETVPGCVLQVAREVGGVADGAFTDEGELVGFVFGITGPRDGKLAHWSHLLAVHECWRDCGIGRRLKAHQRESLLELGVDSMLWTFDPLESRNAHLNLNKLGAKVESYVQDFYGENSIAKTDTFIGTDRFLVRWDLVHPITPSVRSYLSLPDIPCVSARPQAGNSEAVRDPPLIRDRWVRVEVPPNIQALKSIDPQASASWRATTRRAFVHYLDLGYRVVEFRFDAEDEMGCYVLASE